MKNSNIKSMNTMLLIIPMILSVVGSGMNIHPVFAQMSGLVNIKCFVLYSMPGPAGPAGLAGSNGLNGSNGANGANGANGLIGKGL
ncbi:MAG TPA: hypothetical protein VIY08_05590 [Candidatus Nitrosocosmicus sp.]